MSCDFPKQLRYEILVVGLAFLVVCYSKTLKHLMASRCTSIRFGCVSCERQPLSDAAACEVVESPDVVEFQSPTLPLTSKAQNNRFRNTS
jgi:hypothetical protein